MSLIAEYEPPPSIRVQCEAFRILASYRGSADLDKETLLDELCQLCKNDVDFRDVFYAAYTLSVVRMNNTEIFDYVMCQLLLRNKIHNYQPLDLPESTMAYFHKHGISCDLKITPKSVQKCSEIVKIISEDNLQEFIKYTLINMPDHIEAKFREKEIHGSALEISCAFNSENIVRYLIPREKDLKNASIAAAAFGNFSILRLLEQCGADISLTYDAAVFTHQYEIIDWIRFNYKDIQSKNNIELKSNNILAYLTKANGEATFDEALITLRNGNISMFKHMWGAKEPPPRTTFGNTCDVIYYLSICGEYDIVRALLNTDKMNPLKSKKDYLMGYMFLYSDLELSSRILEDRFLQLNGSSYNILAGLGKKEHAKLALETYIKAGFNRPANLAALLCISKSRDYVDMVDFTYKEETRVPSNLLFGTKDVEFTKYVLDRIKIKHDFVHALNIAVIRRNEYMVKFVLENFDCSNKNEHSHFRYTSTLIHHHPLQVAAVVESIPIMEILLTKFDINESSQDGATALHFAAVTGNIELFNYMISKGADLRKETTDGCTILHLAALYGNLEIVERIVELTGSELVNKVDKLTKLTPVSASVLYLPEYGRSVFDFLMSNGGQLNVEGTLTPLMCAINLPNPDESFIMELLENPETDVNAEVECFRGKANALHYAIGYDLNNIARILVDRGARCTDWVRNEIPDIGAAILFLEKDISLRLILEKRYKESEKCPAMMFAVAKGDSALISAILEVSERPEDIETGYCEMTPLKVAVMEGNVDLVELLIKRGANINASHAINRGLRSIIECTNIGGLRHLGIYQCVPMRNSRVSFRFNSYVGTAAELALWKGDERVLEVIGLQGPGIAPKTTSRRLCGNQYMFHRPHRIYDKSSVSFSCDFLNPSAGDILFGDVNFPLLYEIRKYINNYIKNLSDGNFRLIGPPSFITFFPPFHYL